MRMNKIIFGGLLLLLFSCNTDSTLNSSSFLFEQLSSEKTNVDFLNTVTNSDKFNIFSYRNFYNGGGTGLGDINNDGLVDLFFTSNMGENKLYLNEGDFVFKDISKSAGILDANKWSTGVSFVDINHDGYLDIYICNAGYLEGADQNNTLYINNKDLTFTESAAAYGLGENGYTTHASFFDYDNDGDLDVYILNNSFIPVNTLNYSNKRDLRAKDWPVKDFLKGGGDKLLRNDDGKFVDVSEEAGIFGSLIGFGLGVTVGDINNDSWLDIYISNDFFERDYVYINQKDGTFSEELTSYIDHLSHSSMGADMSDINNDGLNDIFVTDMLPLDAKRKKRNAAFDDINLYKLKTSSGFYNQYMHNTLQLNTGEDRFKEISNYANISASDWSWGALMFDMDNDTNTDIFVCNGIYKDVVDLDFIDFFANDIISEMALGGKKEELKSLIDKMPSNPIMNNAFRNEGNLIFTDASEEWGFGEKTFSNGAAYGDLDNDGDLDLVINNVNQESQIFENKSSANFLRVKLKGEKMNPFAIGARVSLFLGDKILSRDIVPNRGFQSSIDHTAVFGLGDYAKVDSLIVVWPDKSKSQFNVDKINTELVLEKKKTKQFNVTTETSSTESSLLAATSSSFDKHQENEFIDFYFERNIPVMLSQEGPKVGVGDVNGDKMDDLYIGGAKGQAGKIYLAKRNGFVAQNSEVFDQYAAFEDTDVLFLDVDSDGDQDLIVGSGGNEYPVHSPNIKDRLFMNDGGGNFSASKVGLPVNGMNTSVILPLDFNGDNLEDIFIGNLNKTSTYGVSPICQLYKNVGGGLYENVVLPKELSFVGMVRDAQWIDILGDKTKELVIVGEWMAPSIFEFKNGTFKKVSSSLSKHFGFWNCLVSADLDNDGDLDLVLGNIGENISFQASMEEPLRIFVADFDQNGEYDKIITQSYEGKNFPIFSKRELTEQLPILKKKNLMHKDFADKGIFDLFSQKIVDAASRKGVSYLSSCIALNQGNGEFNVVKLPADVQLSCVNAILPIDLDTDGDIDMIVGGNNYDFLPQFSRQDASRGHVLLNDGKGNMSVEKESGFYVEGEVKDIKLVNKPNQRQILVTINNEKPKLFNLQK